MSAWRRGSALLAALALSAAGCSAVRYSADYDRQASFREYRTYAWSPASPQERAVLERVNPFLERRLQRAIERELTSRGFVQAAEGEADFLVSVHPLVPESARPRGDSADEAYRTSRSRVSVGVGIGFGRYYGYGYPYFGYRYPYLFHYPYWGFGYYPYWGFGYPRFGFGYPYAAYPGWGAYSPYGYPMGAYGRRYRRGVAPGTLAIDIVDASSDELVWRGWAEGALFEAPEAEKLDEYVDGVVEKILKRFPPPPEDR